MSVGKPDTTNIAPDQLPDEVLSNSTPPAAERVGPLPRAWAATRPYRPVLLLTIGLFVVVSFTTSDFFTNANVQNLLIDVSVLWMIALAQTFALLAGGADLSSGAIVTLIGLFLAKTLGIMPDGLAIVLALVAGAAIGGLVNGVLIGWLGLSFFVVTLGSLTALGGVVILWSSGNSVAINSAPILWLVSTDFLGVAMPIWLMLVTFLASLFLQRKTYFGRNVYAVGGSATAARLSGIRVERTVVLVYALLGFAAALGGILAVGLSGADSPNANSTLALQAIAAVLLGGTPLFGGSGSVVGTALGVLFLGVLENTLNLVGVASAWQSVVTGAILIIAVATVPGAQGTAQMKLVLARLRARRTSALGSESAD